MTAKPSINVTFRITNLGGLPETHLLDHEAILDRFLAAGGADLPLTKQLSIVGEQRAVSMVAHEIQSWLDDLFANPQDIVVKLEHASSATPKS